MSKKEKELPVYSLVISKTWDDKLKEECIIVINGFSFIHADKSELIINTEVDSKEDNK